MSRPQLTALHIADPPERWRALGFAVDDEHTDVGGVRIHLGAPGHGITAWAISGIEQPTEIDGLRTDVSHPTPSLETHPNSATAIDQVVVVTPAFDRTATELESAGIPLRRISDGGGFRQGFRRLGPAILEVVEARHARQTHFWGLAFIVENIDATADLLGDHLGPIRPAVQPGRQIATLNESAGLTTKVAFMSPDR